MFVANWKMNGSKVLVEEWIEGISSSLPISFQSKCVFCPPVCYLSFASELIKKSELNISLGAQDIDPDTGASMTGGISGAMLKEIGCEYVIVGHSERRLKYKENDELLLQKLRSASSNELKIIFCIGETNKEKEAGETFDVIKRQLEILFEVEPNNFLVAYEPIWAIGSGQTADSDYIEKIHELIKKEMRLLKSKNLPRIIYGGSVDSSSAKQIFALNEVDGLLIGGASLKEKEFSKVALKSLDNL